jgi:hypothetical protein
MIIVVATTTTETTTTAKTKFDFLLNANTDIRCNYNSDEEPIL